MNIREQQVISFSSFRKREPEILDTECTTIAIYQLNNKASDLAFRSYESINKEGIYPDYNNYDITYLYNVNNDDEISLDEIYYNFNEDRPSDFMGHSLSVSDVIVISDNKGIKSYYVDSFGFKEIQAFADEILKQHESYVIKISYSWGDEESDILCRNYEEAWETAKKMLFDEAYISASEHESEIGIGFSKEEDRMYIHYLYDDEYCFYDIIKR